MNSLLKNSSIYALGDIIPKLLSFISFPILTQYLTPEEYGIVNYVNTVNLFLIVFSVLCVNTYYLVFYFREKTEEGKKRLLGNLSLFIFIVNILILAIAFGLSPLYSRLGSAISFYPYIGLGILINFFNVFSVLPMAFYRVIENPLPIAIINIIRGAITLITTIVLVVCFDFKATGILFSNLVVNILFLPYFLYIIYKNAILKLNFKQLKDALIFSLPLIPGTISYILISMSDRFLIERYINLNGLGLYSTAFTLALLLNIVSSSTYKAIEPHFFKIYGSEVFNHEFTKIHNFYWCALLIGVLGLSLFSKEFFYLFSSDSFHSAYLYVPFLTFSTFISGVNLLYGTILTAQSKTKVNSTLTILGGIISVSLNILLLPKIGLFGACIASIISFGVISILSIYLSKITIDYKRCLGSVFIATIVIIFSVYIWDINSLLLSLTMKFSIFVFISYLVTYIMDLDIRNGKIFNKLFKRAF